MKTSINDLATKGFIALTYPENVRIAINETARLWQEFCALPEEVKRVFPYSNDGAGVGYESKEGAGPSADLKENFDASSAGKDWLDIHIEKIKNPTALKFVQSATALSELLRPTLLDFARQVEKKYELKGFSEKVLAGKVVPFVRCIHYPSLEAGQVGIETAEAHVDQSAFTFHLWEKGKGVQCLTYADKKWIDMPVSEGEAIAFPAMQMQLMSEGKLRGLYHRVISTADTVKTGRYSMVVFFQVTDIPKYDKTSQGRLQEKPLAFNYDMPHSEFPKLFK